VDRAVSPPAGEVARHDEKSCAVRKLIACSEWDWRATLSSWNPVRMLVSLVYQVARKLLSVPAVLLRRRAAKDAQLLVLQHENGTSNAIGSGCCALLGHPSLSMTRVYARIADRTVADEYFAVSEKVEVLYDAPRQLPADAEGTEMAKLRREMHRRMLGNGYCARPVEMDCHFESICDSCTFFVTTIEFRPTLERQRDDAAAKGQVAREPIFDGLLSRLDEEAS
jgi:hypothetical protein